MTRHEDLTPALSSILRHWNNGYIVWISFITTAEKEDGLEEKWASNFSTKLAAWRRQDMKQKGMPTAVALSAPVIGQPGKRQVMLMATPAALKAEEEWAREQWKTALPDFSDFKMVHEPRDRGDYAWTWRLQPHVENGLLNYWKGLVASGDASEVARDTHHAVKFYPMFGGVRRQLRRIFNGHRKLWSAKWGSPWPGPDPDHLPMMGKFKKAKKMPTEPVSGKK